MICDIILMQLYEARKNKILLVEVVPNRCSHVRNLIDPG